MLSPHRVAACIDRFNSSANQMRDFVTEQCVAVVGLGDQGAFIVMRENFNPGAEPGTWNALGGTSEGSPRELGGRIREPVARGNPDGTIEAE